MVSTIPTNPNKQPKLARKKKTLAKAHDRKVSQDQISVSSPVSRTRGKKPAPNRSQCKTGPGPAINPPGESRSNLAKPFERAPKTRNHSCQLLPLPYLAQFIEEYFIPIIAIGPGVPPHGGRKRARTNRLERKTENGNGSVSINKHSTWAGPGRARNRPPSALQG